MKALSIKALRVNAGYNQTEVANLLDVSKTTVVHWESDEWKPSKVTLRALSNLYDAPYEIVEKFYY